MQPPRAFGATAIGSSLALLTLVALASALAPDAVRAALATDRPGGAGLVENATVLFLVPAVAVGATTLWATRGRLRVPAAGWWLGLWVLACVTFAGEEVSWGQWFAGWGTPEFLARVNQQQETNLHNITPWLNHKPHALVEVFIASCGVLLPVWKATHGGAALFRRGWLARAEEWVIAPPALIGAALLHVCTKVGVWLPGATRTTIGHPEMQEMAIAWFFAWYVAALSVRLRMVASVAAAEALVASPSAVRGT